MAGRIFPPPGGGGEGHFWPKYLPFADGGQLSVYLKYLKLIEEGDTFKDL